MNENLKTAFEKSVSKHLPEISNGVLIATGEENRTFYLVDGTEGTEQLAFMIANAMEKDYDFKEAVKLAIKLYNQHKDSFPDEHISKALAKVIREIVERRKNNG